jgi:hypothetical protein
MEMFYMHPNHKSAFRNWAYRFRRDTEAQVNDNGDIVEPPFSEQQQQQQQPQPQPQKNGEFAVPAMKESEERTLKRKYAKLVQSVDTWASMKDPEDIHKRLKSWKNRNKNNIAMAESIAGALPTTSEDLTPASTPLMMSPALPVVGHEDEEEQQQQQQQIPTTEKQQPNTTTTEKQVYLFSL